jgi:hypothetical protein
MFARPPHPRILRCVGGPRKPEQRLTAFSFIYRLKSEWTPELDPRCGAACPLHKDEAKTSLLSASLVIYEMALIYDGCRYSLR